MYHIYKSDYPNQVHQLNFSISQNHHLLKSGEIKYQQKKFDINWSNHNKTGKRHLVNYLIRDHFSNCFYAELHPIDQLPDLSDFLFNAWKPKENFEFCGVPAVLITGRNIVEHFPGILRFAKNMDLDIQLAKSGFTTGIRSLRDWEHNIRGYIAFSDNKNIQVFQKNTQLICREINLRKTGKTQENLLKWLNNDPKDRTLPDVSTFKKYF